MALRGERIGTAFIKILADASGMDETIARQMEASEPTIEDGAKKHADAYSKGYNEQMDQNKSIEKGLLDQFDEFQGKLDALGKRDGDTYGTSFVEENKKHIRTLSTQIAGKLDN